ncbi:MAG TPA: phosphatase PAP2 family protein [Candidatus Acidoferrum sp.]|nr:phosphatase PAP2 family protein [Candidatus Acidoferrum sp.]
MLAVVAVAATSQESSSITLVPSVTSAIHVMTPAPNFRVGDFRLETLDADNPAPDTAPDTSAGNEPHQGLMKRSIIRIGQDQKNLFKGPFEAHNLKWDFVILVGTGAFLAADRHIENNVSHSHFTVYQAISDTALGGLAGSLAGIYLYGAKTEHHHARETGELELETLVNTFIIYAPMQLIAGRQRPDEGNNHGDFLKHHALNTSFPGGHAMFTWAMASVLADEYPKPWARALSYGAAFTVTFTRFMARDHWSSDMFLGMGLGIAIAERTFHARCNPEFESQCKHHQWWWKPMKMEAQ